MQILNGDFLPTDNLYMKGMTLARCFRVLDSVVLAILIYLGALAFKRVVASEKNQLAYCVQVTSLLLIVMHGIQFDRCCCLRTALPGCHNCMFIKW